MAAVRTKSFEVSDPEHLEKIDIWWAGLLRKDPKEIVGTEWIPNGDISWTLRVSWTKLDLDTSPFKVCMPAYSGFSVGDLTESLGSFKAERTNIYQNLQIFKKKVDDWGIGELDDYDPSYDDYNASNLMDFGIDPTLSYASKLDVVEKIMASEFLWPCYRSMRRALLMYNVKIAEVTKEIELRGNPAYTVVRVDRGMLRTSFLEQLGYDNTWMFATDEELYDEYLDLDGEDS